MLNISFVKERDLAVLILKITFRRILQFLLKRTRPYMWDSGWKPFLKQETLSHPQFIPPSLLQAVLLHNPLQTLFLWRQRDNTCTDALQVLGHDKTPIRLGRVAKNLDRVSSGHFLQGRTQVPSHSQFRNSKDENRPTQRDVYDRHVLRNSSEQEIEKKYILLFLQMRQHDP